MAQVLRGVAGQAQGAEDEVGHHGLLRAAPRGEEGLLQGVAGKLGGEGIAQAGQGLAELLVGVLDRLLVDAEEAGEALLHQVLRHQPVGEEHQLLNEASGLGLRLGDEVKLPLLPHLHLHLGEGEVQGALL